MSDPLYLPPRLSSGLQENVTRIVSALMGIEGLAQADVVERLDMAQPTFSHKMRGTRRWSIDDLESLGRAFGVSTQLFLSDPEQVFGPALKPFRFEWASLTLPYVPRSAARKGHLVLVEGRAS